MCHWPSRPCSTQPVYLGAEVIRVPSAEWKNGIIISLYKGNDRKSDCSNYRPITLLSVPGKVFAHVLLGCIQPLLEATRRPEQSYFLQVYPP